MMHVVVVKGVCATGCAGGGTGNTAMAGPGREPTAALTRLCAAACLTPLCQHTHR